MTDITIEVLYPCPFCGGAPVETWETVGDPHQHERLYWIFCRLCNARGPQVMNRDGARRCWNGRYAEREGGQPIALAALPKEGD
jgi:Lar family restriction alleviation protein